MSRNQNPPVDNKMLKTGSVRVRVLGQAINEDSITRQCGEEFETTADRRAALGDMVEELPSAEVPPEQ